MSFWLYEDTTLARMESTAKDSSPVIEKALEENEGLAEAYKAVADENRDLDAYETPRAFDERVESNKADFEQSVLENGAPLAAIDEVPETMDESGDGIAVNISALCPEPPGWDWSADDRWWGGEICQSANTDYCKTMGTRDDTGWKDKYHFKAAGINFSSCANATFQIWYHRTYFPWGWHSETSCITNHLVYPHYWTTWQTWRDDGEIRATMWSEEYGNYVGLASEWHVFCHLYLYIGKVNRLHAKQRARVPQ